ncbi:hypothetical protein MHBO_005070, partial [Bonamia ostreae]
LIELAGEDAQEKLVSYLEAREKVAQVDLVDDQESNQLPATSEMSDELEAASGQIVAETATVAEFPIIEPYAVRIAIAKNNESFIYSMVLVNRSSNGCLVGQMDVFNSKQFSSVENAVVYGLAMAIDACNAHLPDFIGENKAETCVNILSNYAKDAEGNFIERYIRDLDLSGATFMANSKKDKP